MNKILLSMSLFTFMTAHQAQSGFQKATFAGGCFWCMEPPFEKLKGVKSVISGFMGGDLKNPTYKQVSAGGTGHLEVIHILSDEDQVSYRDMLQVFWRNVNPTDATGQFVDRGEQYATAIFYYSPEQKEEAEESKKAMDQSGLFKAPIVTPVRKALVFYPAEEYHQDYYKKSSIKYKYYRYRSGRDQFIEKIWGKKRDYKPPGQKSITKTGQKKDRAQYNRPSDEEVKKKLTALQYQVTRRDGTEPPFKNEYWDNKKKGIYVDIITGEPLFSSTHKYKSGTGWPSFYQTLVPENIVEKKELLTFRTEVRSRHGDSHLGHVFKDGPPSTGLRYCINSAALRFVAREELEAQGYGQYLKLFP